jgi:hypothetical protein
MIAFDIVLLGLCSAYNGQSESILAMIVIDLSALLSRAGGF